MTRTEKAWGGRFRRAARTNWQEVWPIPAGAPESRPSDAAAGPARLVVGEGGEIRLPEAERRRWGLTPGAELAGVETPDGLLLRRTDPPLTKLYVEPTADCNLSCRTCIRHSWDGSSGRLSLAAYRRLLAGVRDVPTLRTVAFWGFGEPH